MFKLVIVSYFIFSVFEVYLIILNDRLISAQQPLIQYHLSKPTIVRKTVIIESGKLKIERESKPPYNQFDFILDRKKWDCSLFGTGFRWSVQDDHDTKIVWLGTDRQCVRYERRGKL